MVFVQDDNTTSRQEDASVPRITDVDAAWLRASLARGKREVFNEIITLRPGMAAAILDLNSHNRRFAPMRAEGYARVMLDGRWRVTHQGLALDKNGVLIDGQHRCGAVVLANKPIRMMVSFGWEPENFSLVDTGAKRSAGDLASIDGMPNAALRASIARMIQRIRTKDVSGSFDPNLILQICRELHDNDMDEAIKFGQNVNAHRLMTPTGGALAMWTIRKNTKHSNRIGAFEESFLAGTELSKTSPILRARENIKFLPKGSKSTAIKQAAAVIMAWNAYIRGKQLHSLSWGYIVQLPEVL